MAGFFDGLNTGRTYSSIRNAVRNITTLGMKYEDLVIKNSQAVGQTESNFTRNTGLINNDAFYYVLSSQDTQVRKYIAYFDKDYLGKREFLRKFSLNGEIDFILDTLSDESIVYDDKNFFCQPAILDIDVEEDVLKKIRENFRTLYLLFGFQNGITAWQYFKQFLIDGFLAFEIVYSDDAKKIVGFKELDPTSLSPDVERKPDGTFVQVWVQFPDDAKMRRVLYDSQIIYISYANGNQATRVSYIERLVRSFNILRIMEQSRVIWNVMNASYRMKMVIPVGTQSPQKAKETLGSLLSLYKEDYNINTDSGELTVNGRPKIQFYKNYLFPDRNGESPTIEKLNSSGPDFNVMENVVYFYNKLKMDSKIPYARFAFKTGSPSNVQLAAENLERDEIRFGKFLNRLRSIFQELMVKPLYIQMTLDEPSLKDDPIFRTQLSIDYFKENNFEEMRDLDLLKKEVDFIVSLSEIKEAEEKSFFNMDFLIDRYLSLTKDDVTLNRIYKEKEAKEAPANKPEEGAAGEAGEKPEGEETEAFAL